MNEEQRPIKILIADDQAVIRAGLAMLLDSQCDFAVVGQADNGEHAVTLANRLAVDVVLMDIRMPVMDGLEATRRLLADPVGAAAVRVVVLTTYDTDEYVYEALQAGACGFLLKHAPPEELLLGVRAAHDGGAMISPTVTRRLIRTFTAHRPAPGPPPTALERLTPRERQVFDLVISGLSNAEIAGTLTIAETTVKTHVNHALDKLGLRDRVQAVVYGYEHQLISQ